MKHYLRQKGSGLLLTVLTLAAFLAVSGIVIQVFLTLSRTNGSLAASGAATSIADSGIQEGLLRYSSWWNHDDLSSADVPSGGSTLNGCGEYGVGAYPSSTLCGSYFTPYQAYNLLPYERGFIPGSECQVLTPDQDPSSFSGDLSCPYYKLAIRSKVLLSQRTSYTFPLKVFKVSNSDSSMKANFTVTTANSSNTFTGSLSVSGSGLGSYVCSMSNGIQSNPTTLTINSSNSPGISILPIDPQIHSFTLTCDASSAGSLLLQINIVNGNVLVDKGFTTIESTGYAGGVRQEELLNIYDKGASPIPWPATPKFERQSNQVYGSNGCFIYSTPSPTCIAQ